MNDLKQNNIADIRKALFVNLQSKTKKIPLWMVADKLQIHRNSLRNWLSKEHLGIEKRIRIMAAINEIKEELKNNGILE